MKREKWARCGWGLELEIKEREKRRRENKNGSFFLAANFFLPLKRSLGNNPTICVSLPLLLSHSTFLFFSFNFEFFLFLFLNALIARKFDPVCFWISDLDSLGPDFGGVVSGVEWKG